eukprot:14420762-Ditylum_brightwellii.AAC.1
MLKSMISFTAKPTYVWICKRGIFAADNSEVNYYSKDWGKCYNDMTYNWVVEQDLELEMAD